MSLASLIFLVLIVDEISANEFKCDPKYSKLSLEHTMCIDPKSNTDCEIIKQGINDEDKEMLLQLHNEIRSKVATGKDGLPEAGDMLELVWDEELAQVAQRHVETCKYEHDCNDCRMLELFGVGQNIAEYMSNQKMESKEEYWKRFMKGFYDEKSSFSRHENLINHYVAGPTDEENQYGHYSQIIWSETWRVGCGWVYFNSGSYNTSYLACNYGPTGNVFKWNVYKKGPPCSSCPRNTCCRNKCADFDITSKYEGLCKVVKETISPTGIGERDSEVLFICDNYGQADCDSETSGDTTDWKLLRSINGNWIRIELKGGQTSNMMMKTPFKNTTPDFCCKIKLRSFTVTEGQTSSFKGFYKFTAKNGKEETGTFNIYDNRRNFMTVPLEGSMPIDDEITTALSFEVEPEEPALFIDIKKISVTRGKCQKSQS